MLNRTQLAQDIISELENLVPESLKVPEDAAHGGNVAVCIIDETGCVYGKMFGTDHPKMRRAYLIAWTKASQVWLTGERTGEYERLVFTGKIPENSNGIPNPDLIGWLGGQPLVLKDGTKLSVGFSGFRGPTDVEIVLTACRNLGLLKS